MSESIGAEAYNVCRTVDYLQELGQLAMPNEPPRLDLVIEIFNTVDVIISDLMRIRPRMMAERNGLARLQAMQATVVRETDGDAIGALVEMIAGPAMFILVCGQRKPAQPQASPRGHIAGAKHVFARHRARGKPLLLKNLCANSVRISQGFTSLTCAVSIPPVETV